MTRVVVTSAFGGFGPGDLITGDGADQALIFAAGKVHRVPDLDAADAPASLPPEPGAAHRTRIELVVIEAFEGHLADTVISDAAVIEEIEQGPNAGKVRRVVI
jgi:hypothetical protein